MFYLLIRKVITSFLKVLKGEKKKKKRKKNMSHILIELTIIKPKVAWFFEKNLNNRNY